MFSYQPAKRLKYLSPLPFKQENSKGICIQVDKSKLVKKKKKKSKL
jgi:hypothetical protein